MPVYEGFAIPFATIRLDMGGKDLTEHLAASLLADKGLTGLEINLEDFTRLKEKKCFVSYDFDASVKEHQKKEQKELAIVLPLLLVLFGAGAASLSGQLSNAFTIPGTESQEAIDRLSAVFPQAAGASAQMIFVAPEGDSISAELASINTSARAAAISSQK